MRIMPIKTSETSEWLLKKHYAKRLPSISWAYGLYEDSVLMGVVTYGKPASPSLCDGICGKEYSHYVYELNRLVVGSLAKNASSILVGRSLNLLPKPLVIVSYADTGQGHVGYIYQATNWLYTGKTVERTDIWTDTHSRHYTKGETRRKFRSAKHRYVQFIGDRRFKKKMAKALNYKVCPYPKGESKRYDASFNPTTQSVMSFM